MTRAYRLQLHTQPALRVDAAALQPAALAALAPAAVEALALPHGRGTLALAELFRVEAVDAGEGASLLQIEGDLGRFDRIGAGLAGGRIEVAGTVGDLAGAGMTGGTLAIRGDAGDSAGCAMAGGRLEIDGRAGDYAASARPGDMDGMKGGVLRIGGGAGARLADRMRRGTVVVFGDVGDYAASRMVAGTLALAGRCGAHLGYGMRRGSIVFAGPRPAAGPTFVPLHSNADVFWQLLARDLAAFGGPFAGLAQRAPERAAGDRAVDGKGELLWPA